MTLHPVLRFTLLCSAIVLGALLLMWAVLGFSGFGMSGQGLVAMVLGTVLSVLLGCALMALLFHSEHLRGGDRPRRVE